MIIVYLEDGKNAQPIAIFPDNDLYSKIFHAFEKEATTQGKEISDVAPQFATVDFNGLVSLATDETSKITAEQILRWHGGDHNIEELAQILADVANGEYAIPTLKQEVLDYSNNEE